ncbi:MAG: helix-turn-helix transcriptional regulator [Clostridia bacterium]|nr:helix-turn-helix transcriptional regulator [Clostridia bacterium]
MKDFSTNLPMDIHVHTGDSPVVFRDSSALWIVICREGSAEYLRDKVHTTLSPNDILLLPPGKARNVITPQSGKLYRHIALYIGDGALQTIEKLEKPIPAIVLERGYHLIRTSGTQFEHLTSFADSILAEAQRGQGQVGRALLLAGRITTLLGLMIRYLQDDQSLSYEQGHLLSRIRNYVEHNLENKITLAETAHYFLVSESYISKLFRSQLDNSFYNYVIQRRLIAARRLIASGVPLEQIATQVGFADHAAFYRAFKKAFGVSPRQYRSEQLNRSSE